MSSLFEKAMDKLGDSDEPPVRKRPLTPPFRDERPPVGAKKARAGDSGPSRDAHDEARADERAKGPEEPIREPTAARAQAPREPAQEPTRVEPPAPDAPSPATPAATPGRDVGSVTGNYAEIDLEAMAAAGMITPDAAETTLSEQHRMIKRPLLLKAFPTEGKRVGNENVILVTSSVPAEGKTFVSVNLAMSIAMEVDRTVLLVDGDPARGNIAKSLGINAERGLTDYLASPDMPLPDVLVRTNVPNLVLLPSGKHVANVTELFSSEQMKRLTEELAARYSDRIVLIDSAPLLATSGTRVLSALAGQVLFVVEAVRTTQSAVREALHMIETHPNIGLVLNKSRERPRSSYSYGYYGAQD